MITFGRRYHYPLTFLFLGAPKSFSIKVKPAENFPVNLYYLMDMSKSMEDDLDKLRTLGTKIGMSMRVKMKIIVVSIVSEDGRSSRKYLFFNILQYY